MTKNYEKFNKFCENYNVYGDGIEEEVVNFLKKKFPKEYFKAKEDLINAGATEDEVPSPGSIFSYLTKSDEDVFYSLVKKWFEKNYPKDELN